MILCSNKKQNVKYKKCVSILLSRILVCKPHSADCERLISAYNKLKTQARSSLSRSTLSDYLYVHINMPELCNFNPRPAGINGLMKWNIKKEIH